MRLIPLIGTIGGVLLRAYLASVVAYAGFLAYQLLQGSLWRWIAVITAPLLALAVGLASLPIALLGSGTARAAWSVRGPARWPAMLLGPAIAALAGIWLFICYMTALLPLVDWRWRWPWALAAVIGAYLLECAWLRWRRATPPTV
jgi:hypothetical protein